MCRKMFANRRPRPNAYVLVELFLQVALFVFQVALVELRVQVALFEFLMIQDARVPFQVALVELLGVQEACGKQP